MARNELVTPLGDSAMDETLNSLRVTSTAEDTTNTVMKIERQGEWETVAASQTDQVLGSTGAAGDYLEKLIITVGTAATAAGGADPLFVAPSVFSVSATNFKIQSSSVAKRSGKPVAFVRDYRGKKLSLTAPSRGLYQDVGDAQ